MRPSPCHELNLVFQAQSFFIYVCILCVVHTCAIPSFLINPGGGEGGGGGLDG